MPTNVCLVNMPYSSLTHPSLALGLIESYILEYNHTCQVIYGNLEFAEKIGLAEYDAIDNSHFEQLIGEWTFSRAAFPEKETTDDQFFALFSDITDDIKQQLLDVREQAEQYIELLSQRIINKMPKVVACTSTFQQNCASLALLKNIKQQYPDIITLMGGANCEGIMGQTISENFTWVDYVFSGECDAVIGEFVDKLLRNEPIGAHNLPHGFITQRQSDLLITKSKNNHIPPRGYIEDMNQVGMPIFDSYFDVINELELQSKIDVGLLSETSRGCWWGAKKHCTFCGLNGNSMEHRFKPEDTVLAEFKQLSDKYSITKFEVVDNILPMEYMKTLIPELGKEQNYSIFFETKSNLKKTHIEQLANAGIKWIQPGFESLHDDFLKLIDKGVTAVQNISALKWCRNCGVRVSWNFLYGAPKEQEEWYVEMAEILPLLVHLQPPFHEMIKIRYARFSPYFKNSEKYGLLLEPLKSYQYIYPLEQQELFNIAYFFDQVSDKNCEVFSLQNPLNYQLKGHQALQTQLSQWMQFWTSGSVPLLYMSEQGEKIVIIDTRQVATSFTHQLTGLSATVYRLCAEPVTKIRLISKLNKLAEKITESDLEGVLKKLVADNILLSLSNCYLALALKGETPPLPDDKDYPSGHLNLD